MAIWVEVRGPLGGTFWQWRRETRHEQAPAERDGRCVCCGAHVSAPGVRDVVQHDGWYHRHWPTAIPGSVPDTAVLRQLELTRPEQLDWTQK